MKYDEIATDYRIVLVRKDVDVVVIVLNPPFLQSGTRCARGKLARSFWPRDVCSVRPINMLFDILNAIWY